MIYVDEVRDYGSKGKWCHMWSDMSRTELEAFADTLGLKREWVQISYGVSGEFIHYDLRPSKRELALKRGAEFMPLSRWIVIKNTD